MSRKGPAQLQKQLSTPNDNLRAKTNWENNVRQLRHQTSFSGVSYLDVIKERERSDSGFSGDVYEELGNETSFLKSARGIMIATRPNSRARRKDFLGPLGRSSEGDGGLGGSLPVAACKPPARVSTKISLVILKVIFVL